VVTAAPIKEQYDDADLAKQKLAAFDAFSLYLNLINLVQLLLSFVGEQRS